MPIAGDDLAAKTVTADLINRFGFDCADAGALSEGWRFERARPACCVAPDRDDLTEALASAKRDVEVLEGSWRTWQATSC